MEESAPPMKIVILYAFQGRLRSEPMEWPDEPREIKLPVSEDLRRIGKGCFVNPERLTQRMALFLHTGQYERLPNGQTAVLYEMVNI